MRQVSGKRGIACAVVGLLVGLGLPAAAQAVEDPLKADQGYLAGPAEGGMIMVTGAGGAFEVAGSPNGSGVGSGIILAVIGDGVDMTHEDLQNQGLGTPGSLVEYQCSATTCTRRQGQTPLLAGKRATAAAGIAAAESNNGLGILSIAPAARILNMRTDLSANPNAALTQAIQHAVVEIRNNADVTVGTDRVAEGVILILYDEDLGIDASLESLLRSLYLQQGTVTTAQGTADLSTTRILVVAPAGNGVSDGGDPPMYYPSDEPSYPCAYEDAALEQKLVVCVGSLDWLVETRGQRSVFSNYGLWVDLSAPGQHIVATVPGNGYEYVYDTGAAAAMVAGIAVDQVFAGGDPFTASMLSPEQLAEGLRFTAAIEPPVDLDDPNLQPVLSDHLLRGGPAVAYAGTPVPPVVARLRFPGQNSPVMPNELVRIRGTAVGSTYALTITHLDCCPNEPVLKDTLASGTPTPIMRRPNAILYTWSVPSSVDYPEGQYELRLTVSGGTTTVEAATRIFIEKSYDSSFNNGQRKLISDVVFHGPNLADVDGDGGLEIVLGSAARRKVYVFGGSGIDSQQAPLALPVSGRIFGAPAVGDIDGDDSPEIIAAVDVSAGPSLYGWEVNGDPLFTPVPLGQIKSSPVLAKTNPTDPFSDLYLTLLTNKLQWYHFTPDDPATTPNEAALVLQDEADLTDPTEALCQDANDNSAADFACNALGLMESTPLVAGVKPEKPARVYVSSQDPFSTYGFKVLDGALQALPGSPMPWISPTRPAPGGIFDTSVAPFDNKGAKHILVVQYLRDPAPCARTTCQDSSQLVMLKVKKAMVLPGFEHLEEKPEKKKKKDKVRDSVFTVSGSELFMYSGVAAGNFSKDHHHHHHCHGGTDCHDTNHSHNKHRDEDEHPHDEEHDADKAKRRKPDDGELEAVIVGMSGKVYVFDEDMELAEAEHNEAGELCPDGATAGWPQQMGGRGSGVPLIADLDGDGENEVVATSSDNLLYAWDKNGCLKRKLAGPDHVLGAYEGDPFGVDDTYGFPRGMKSPACSLPRPARSPLRNWSINDIIRCGAIATGDLDQDGVNELVAVAGSGPLNSNAIYVWQLGYPSAGGATALLDGLEGLFVETAEATEVLTAPRAPVAPWGMSLGGTANSASAASAVIEGTVTVVGSGEPLEGASVTLSRPMWQEALDPADLDENGTPDVVDAKICLAQPNNGMYFCNHVLCKTTTGPDGSYRCPDLNPDVSYQMKFRKSGYRGKNIPSGVVSLGDPLVVDVQMQRCYVLSAAYGRPDAPQIAALWALHQQLVPQAQWDAPWHARYMRWYDELGPKVAAFIEERPTLKALVRGLFTPLADLARWWLSRNGQHLTP